MQYAIYALIDHGYVNADTGEVLESIAGLDNQTVRIAHQGMTGYPSTGTILADNGAACLAAFDGDPDDGGTAVAEADVPVLLVADYGWPEGTEMGADGLPVAPEE